MPHGQLHYFTKSMLHFISKFRTSILWKNIPPLFTIKYPVKLFSYITLIFIKGTFINKLFLKILYNAYYFECNKPNTQKKNNFTITYFIITCFIVTCIQTKQLLSAFIFSGFIHSPLALSIMLNYNQHYDKFLRWIVTIINYHLQLLLTNYYYNNNNCINH